ncbi:MAG TPA: transcriptional regulator NrdR [Myxococcota bacterium]|nr:transcriptional regulator NrdR [Myxococcota bacterium]HQK49914.1 transcriptional regulator NrdR [Myxococcota bacterium]
MRCPFCGHPDSRVVDSREASEGAAIRRRRLCPVCSRRFTTYERREEFAPRVIKRDGRREEFRRQKVLEGLQRACEKRAVSQEELDRFVDTLLLKIQDQILTEVETRWIGEQVMAFLKERDPVAYVRFASVYRRFTDLTAFEEEIRDLLSARVGHARRSRRGTGGPP